MSRTSDSEDPGEAPKPKLSLRLKKNGDAEAPPEPTDRQTPPETAEPQGEKDPDASSGEKTEASKPSTDSASMGKPKEPEDEQVTTDPETGTKHGIGFFLAAGGIAVLILGLLVLAFYLLTFLFPGESESPKVVVAPDIPVASDPPATPAQPSPPEAPAGGVSVEPRAEEIPAQLATAEVGENPEIETFLEGLGTILVLEDSTQARIVVRNVAYAVGDLVEPHTGLRVAAIHLDESLVYFVDSAGERYAREF